MVDRNEIVLILGDLIEPHITAVIQQLTLKGQRTLVLDPWNAWQLPLCLSYASGAAVIHNGSETLALRSVWLRLKPMLGGGPSEEEAFALRERREFLMGWLATATGASLINDPWNQDWAKNKPLQLFLANQLGLTIPRTWITTDVDKLVLEGTSIPQGLIYKPLSWLASVGGKILFTNSVSLDDLITNREAIRLAPGIFQELIKKRYEYRITIIDDEMFPVRVFSQERQDTALDWRRNQAALRYESCHMPDVISEKLMRLMGHLRLRFAAIDLIETLNGDFVFLEANPAGNWLWLEERLQLPISSVLAHTLIS